jgi:hypothetical protein
MAAEQTPPVIHENPVASFNATMGPLLQEGFQAAIAGNASGHIDERAKAKRTLQVMLDVYTPRPAGTLAPDTPFEKTPFSPNEISAGLEDIAAGLSDENSDVNAFRAYFDMPTPTADQREDARTRTVFTLEEEPIAIAMMGSGLETAKMAQKAGKVLAPEVLFPEESLPHIHALLAERGYLTGTAEEQAAAIAGVRAKLGEGLQKSITAKLQAPRKLRRELA